MVCEKACTIQCCENAYSAVLEISQGIPGRLPTREVASGGRMRVPVTSAQASSPSPPEFPRLSLPEPRQWARLYRRPVGSEANVAPQYLAND